MKYGKNYEKFLLGVLDLCNAQLLPIDEFMNLVKEADQRTKSDSELVVRELSQDEARIFHLEASCLEAVSNELKVITAQNMKSEADQFHLVYLLAILNMLGNITLANCYQTQLLCTPNGSSAFVKIALKNDALVFVRVEQPKTETMTDANSKTATTAIDKLFDLEKWQPKNLSRFN